MMARMLYSVWDPVPNDHKAKISLKYDQLRLTGWSLALMSPKSRPKVHLVNLDAFQFRLMHPTVQDMTWFLKILGIRDHLCVNGSSPGVLCFNNLTLRQNPTKFIDRILSTADTFVCFLFFFNLVCCSEIVLLNNLHTTNSPVT